MKKVRVRYVVKPRSIDPGPVMDHSYEMDLSKREFLSQCLERKLEDSLNDLERVLKRTKLKADA
jgi:hypothetical protein